MALLELVKNRASVEEVYETFYHEDCVSQENQLPPRKGRALSIERQNKVNAALKEIHDFGIGAVLVDGDHAVIQWYFEAASMNSRFTPGRTERSSTNGFSTTPAPCRAFCSNSTGFTEERRRSCRF
jgi:hypothetical protein